MAPATARPVDLTLKDCEKWCAKCGKVQDKSEFGTVARRGRVELTPSCKKANADASYRSRRTKNGPVKIRRKPREVILKSNEKWCPGCQSVLDRNNFNKGKQSRIQSLCKNCKAKIDKTPEAKILRDIYRNKKSSKIKKNEHQKFKLKTDPVFKFTMHTRLGIIKGLSGNAKSSKTETLLGCSFAEGKKYLESLFWPGMTWENYGEGGWHIDHILPMSSFDMKNPIEQRQAFHFTNLQPLWWDLNLAKAKKILTDEEWIELWKKKLTGYMPENVLKICH